MSVFYSRVARSLIFLQLLTAVSWRWVYFPSISWPGALIVYIQSNGTKIKGSACGRTCVLCQPKSRKRCFGKMSMTSNCDVTNSSHQIQMTTICHWMKLPLKMFCVRHCPLVLTTKITHLPSLLFSKQDQVNSVVRRVYLAITAKLVPTE